MNSKIISLQFFKLHVCKTNLCNNRYGLFWDIIINALTRDELRLSTTPENVRVLRNNVAERSVVRRRVCDFIAMTVSKIFCICEDIFKL